MSASNASQERPVFYRDTRVLGVIAQIVFAIAVVLLGYFLINNMFVSLEASNIPLGWEFLQQEAGFAIAEGPTFDPSDSYLQAFFVGVINTLRVAVTGIILATLLGLVTGIARLSNNWLLKNIAGGYIELIRNTPLLVQLFFWYFAVILKLPDIQSSIFVQGVGYLSKRGVALNWLFISESGQPWIIWLGIALLSSMVVWWFRRRQLNKEGLVGSALPWAIPAFLAIAIIGYIVTAATVSLPQDLTYELRRGDRGQVFVDVDGNGTYESETDQVMRYIPVTLLDAGGNDLGTMRTDGNGEFRFADLEVEGTDLSWETPAPLFYSQPELSGFNFRGGQSLSPEFFALLLGLVIYTAAFIAEIVRAGINAVPKGQWEASRALGLSANQTLRMIVLPQALRVIIPPMTSQYLNLTKNSSLAVAVGYPDLFNVSRTIFNQSGAAIQVFLMIMATYLSFSLLTSMFMNWYNQRMALVER